MRLGLVQLLILFVGVSSTTIGDENRVSETHDLEVNEFEGVGDDGSLVEGRSNRHKGRLMWTWGAKKRTVQGGRQQRMTIQWRCIGKKCKKTGKKYFRPWQARKASRRQDWRRVRARRAHARAHRARGHARSRGRRVRARRARVRSRRSRRSRRGRRGRRSRGGRRSVRGRRGRRGRRSSRGRGGRRGRRGVRSQWRWGKKLMVKKGLVYRIREFWYLKDKKLVKTKRSYMGLVQGRRFRRGRTWFQWRWGKKTRTARKRLFRLRILFRTNRGKWIPTRRAFWRRVSKQKGCFWKGGKTKKMKGKVLHKRMLVCLVKGKWNVKKSYWRLRRLTKLQRWAARSRRAFSRWKKLAKANRQRQRQRRR